MEGAGLLEVWLKGLEQSMVQSVKSQTVAAMEDYLLTKRTMWARSWPAMVILAVSSIFWSQVHWLLSTPCPSPEAINLDCKSKLLVRALSQSFNILCVTTLSAVPVPSLEDIKLDSSQSAPRSCVLPYFIHSLAIFHV